MSQHEAEADVDALLDARTDPEAFGAFYRRNAEWVIAYVARRVGDPEAVADLVAESFAQALIGLSRYDPGKGAPNSWLLGIVSNQVHIYWRRGSVERRAQRRLAMERQSPTEDDVAMIDLLSEDVVAVPLLARLPQEQRTAIRERVLRGHEYEHIAASSGVSEATIRKRVSRGLATLRRLKGASRG